MLAGAAHANIDLFAATEHSDNRVPGQGENSTQQLFVGHGYTGPNAVAAIDGTSPNGATWNDMANASFGTLRFSTSAGGPGGSTAETATASFEDELLFNNLPAGTAGVATFHLHLTGELYSEGSGAWDYLVRLESNRGATQSVSGASAAGGGLVDIDQMLTFTIAFVSGQTTNIRLLGHSGVNIFGQPGGTFGHPGSAYADFSHTALWGGLTSAVTTGGVDVTHDLQVTGNSGFNYEAAAPTGVPEPVSWALMLVGFGGVGVGLRRRRRAVA